MLGGRLRAARHARFVGRSAERDVFQTALQDETLPFHILYIFGPGGVGKTTLLREFSEICEHLSISSLYLDVRNVEPTAEAFLLTLRIVLNLTPQQPLFASLPERLVILIDTYETFAPLDDWMREIFLPQLPADMLVALAGRNPPTLAWRTDPGWQILMRVISLRNLAPMESEDYLARRRIPVDQHQAILNFTHGHPLALSLVADVFDQRPNMEFQPENVLDVVKTLLGQFVQKVPDPAHRAALEVFALVRLTTESLLAEILLTEDAHDLFEWLTALSFVEIGSEGLFPHDLAREALLADLHWRNPNWYAELHRRARAYYLKLLNQVAGLAQQRVLFDYIFLHRENPLVKPFFEWQTSGTLTVDAMQAEDLPPLKSIVARHEGEESARVASYWLSRMPQSVLVWRSPKKQPVGFLLMLPLTEAAANENDPAVVATWRYLQNHAPVRAGEVATLFRFWMADETYQAVSPVQSLIFVNMVRHYLATPGLAFTFLPCADPDFWSGVFSYADLARIPSADFTVGGRKYGMYGHDWRTVPPMPWLALLAEREIAASSEEIIQPVFDSLIVLSKDEFDDAVRLALRDLSRTDMLRSNPLLRSRLIMERSGVHIAEAERVALLQKVLNEAAEILSQSPRQTKAYRAIYHTYLQPAPTQEQAAELLDLPFSTYRRHLKQGMAFITETLWQQEIGTQSVK